MKRPMAPILAGGLAAALIAASPLSPSVPIQADAHRRAVTAGGAVDLLSRYLCERFPRRWGSPAWSRTRPDAGGMIGIDLARNRSPTATPS